MITDFKTLHELLSTFATKPAAINYLTSIRWKDGQFCPYCQHTKVYTLKNSHRYKCANPACKAIFSIMVGTIFENTKLPLKIWFGTIWLLVNNPNGIGSIKAAEVLGTTQKTMWFIMHRLRHAAETKSFNAALK